MKNGYLHTLILTALTVWMQPSAAQGVSISGLRDALAVALAEHPTLRARQAEVAAANSDVATARWQYWPTPAISVSRPDKALIHGTDRSVATASLKQPLWTGGRLDASLTYAEARNQTARVVYDETRRDLALETIQAWGEVCSASARVTVYQASVQAHQKFLQQIRRRTDSGLSVQSDTELASSRLDAVQADLSNAQAGLRSALERLRTLTGQQPTPPYAQPDILLTKPVTEEDIHKALQIDPGLLRLQSEIQELQAQMASVKSSNWPDVYATVTQRHGDVTGTVNQVAIGFETKWGAGLSNASTLQAATQRLQAKQEEVEHRTRKLAEQIRSDQQQLQATQARVRAFRQALVSANAVAQSWDRQFAAGKKSWQEVMNAARESTQTEIQLVDAIGATTVLDWRLAVLTRGIDGVLQSPKVQP